jgi:hypothetical protein
MKGKAAAAGDDDYTTTPFPPPSLDNRRAYGESRQIIVDERWRAKSAVLASVTASGPLRWAHEIIALADAGLHCSPTAVEIARAALRERVAA